METDEYRRMAEAEDRHWWYAATRALLAQLLEPHLAPGGLLLDAGGGTGATGAWLGRAGRLVATDMVPDALAAYRSAHPGIVGAAAADVRAQPFADASFDAALCVTVLCHRSIEDPVDAVRELARVVRPGGIVCLWEPGVRRLRRAHDRVTHSARRFSRADLRGVAEQAGLQVVRATGAHAYLVPPAAVKSVVERGRSASDLDQHQGGLGGVLGRAAAAERRLLRHVDLPAGLSVVVVARRPECAPAARRLPVAVSFRPPGPHDVDWLVEACNDAEVQRWTRVPSPYRRLDAEAFVRDGGGELETHMVVDARSGDRLGMIGLRGATPALEIGYWLHPAGRGRGAATAALNLLHRRAVDVHGAASTSLRISPGNRASIAVAERCGYVLTERVPGDCHDRDVRTDSLVYTREA